MVCSRETRTLSITPCNLEISSIGKDTSRKTLQSLWKGPYQVLLTNPCVTKLQGVDSWIHVSRLKKTPSLTGPAHHLVASKQRFPRTETNNIWWDSFPKMSGPGLYTLFSLLLLTSFCPSLPWTQHSCLHFPIPWQKGKPILPTMAFQVHPHCDPITNQSFYLLFLKG